MQSLLTKQKQVTLEYLLIKRNGDIFDLLMNFTQYHSLAILVIELLQIQIKPEASETSKKTKMSFYNSDGSDNENQEEEQEG